MAHKIHRLAPTGNMDKDSDVRYVGRGDERSGDYLDAQNIQRVSPDGNIQGSVEPTLGNEFAYDLGSVSQQNKRYRITFDGDATKQHELRFLSTQRDANMVVGSGTDGALQFNGTRADFLAQFAAFSLPNLFSTFNIGTDAVEIELNPYPMYQWFLESIGPDPVQVACVREAIPVDLAGPLKDIGSYDLLGDLFIFSTTQDNEPEELDLSVVDVGPTTGTPPNQIVGPLTTITFSAPHGLVQGQWIRIVGSEAPWLNGLFVVFSIVSPTQIQIPTVLAWTGAPVPLFTVGSEKVFINPSGIGEIGVAQKDEDADSWTYTRLLRSVELNFVSKWQIDCDGERNQDRTSIYYDDDYNPKRKFYYYGEYSQDGALSHVNESNHFRLDFVRKLSYGHSIKPGVKFSFVSQEDSGGLLKPGNIRYFCVLQDVFGNKSKPTDMSQHVITYSDKPTGLAVGDSDEVTSTGKVNNLLVEEVDDVVFSKAFYGYAVNVNGALSAFLIDEEVDIVNGKFSIRHTGFEDEVPYDTAEISSSGIRGYDYAKNTRIIDNRLVRSNLRKRELNDFSEWARTFKHRIKERFIDRSTTTSIGEYQDPENGFYRTGYMFNETYRFAVRARLIETGEMTPWFWVDDITVTPFSVNDGNQLENRRDQTGPEIVTNFDLLGQPFGTPVDRKVKIPYIEFFGANMNFPIEGVPLSQLVDFIEFGREEVIPEVICTGALVQSVRLGGMRNQPYRTTNTLLTFEEQGFSQTAMCFPFSVFSGNEAKYLIYMRASEDSNIRFEYPFAYGPPTQLSAISGVTTYITGLGANFIPIYEYGHVDGAAFGVNVRPSTVPQVPDFTPFIADRKICTLYSPDLIFGNLSVEKGYGLIDFGEMFLPTDSSFWNAVNANQAAMTNAFSVYYPVNTGSSFVDYEIDEWKIIETGDVDFLSSGIRFQKGISVAHRRLVSQEFSFIHKSHKNPTSPVLYVNGNGSGIENRGLNPDYGVRYVQVYRQRQGKYGSIKNSEYFPTGNFYGIKDVPTVAGVASKGFLNVFGGDTMTQLTYLKGRYIDKDAAVDAGFSSWTGANFDPGESPGFGGGMLFYSQNRVNSQMRYDDSEQIVALADGPNPIHPWLEEFEGLKDLLTYSGRFTPSLPIGTLMPSYDLESDEGLDFPQRIEYSDRKIYSEKEDAYVVHRPLNIKDLDLSLGEINHHENVNGELFTLQPRKWQRQLFNTRGELQVSGNAIGAVIGDGSVLARDGQTLSRYGTENKWSCVLGASQGGKDVLYWFNAENGLFMRFGADGTVVLSDARRVRSFSNKAAKWVRGKDIPAYDQGIRAVWDDRSKETIWTFTGWRDVQEWALTPPLPAFAIPQGRVVVSRNAPPDTYEHLPRFFRCKESHIPTAVNEPGVGPNWQERWEQIPYTDTDYYSVFTIAHNEMSNGFTTFYGHIPKTYLKWRDTFLSSHPVFRNLIFEHRRGLPTTWYGKADQGIAPKIEDAYVEMVLNNMPEQTMRGVAVRYLSDNVPDRVDYRTRRHKTFDTAATLEAIDDYYTGPIRNDDTVTGDPAGDGQPLSGDYLRIKFTIFGGTYNLLHSMVVKIFDRLRRVNR